MRPRRARPYLRWVQTHAPPTSQAAPEAVGLGLTLASTIAFSWIGVLTQLGYDSGATIGTMLSGRFLVAAAMLWPIVIITRARRPPRRLAAAALLLGVGYGAHAWLFSESLARLDAGLVDLLLFTYPTLVTLGAIALGRDRASRRRTVAVTIAAAGTALVLIGGLGTIDVVGVGLALGSAIAYAAYILTAAKQLEQTDPLVMIALVVTGAALALTVTAAGRQDLSIDIGASALGFTAAVGAVAVTGMIMFGAGIRVLGPSRASIVSAVQPALTPLIGFAVFADHLRPAQLSGGALVVASIVILETRSGEDGFLALLPRHERRMLSRATIALTVPAGQSLVRQGDLAERFFVIERGRAIVTRDSRPVADLGRGDCFGELALLEHGLRTASVEAVSDMRLHVLTRHDFARAIKTLPTMAGIVHRTARQRLVLATQPT